MTTTSSRMSTSVALKDEDERGPKDVLPQHVHEQRDLNYEYECCLMDKHKRGIKDK